MATARLTFGTVLDTVSTAAVTVTGALDTVSTTIGMANAFVTKAANEQALRHTADNETFIDRLIEEKAMEQTAINLEIETFVAKSERHKFHYEQAYDRYAAILKKKAPSHLRQAAE